MDFKQIAVIGAGTIGRGVCQVISRAGIEVIAVEKDEETLRTSLEKIGKELDRQIDKWEITQSEKKAILARIEGTTKLPDIRDVDLAIECVPEDLEAKKDIFHKVDSICKKGCIITSSTSTISISDLGSATDRQDRIVGLHFINPVTKVPVIEFMGGADTSDETIDSIHLLIQRIGKAGVEAKEHTGYITTRIIMPLLNEAMYVLMEGATEVEDIDRVVKLGYGFSTGPLTLADQIGLDVVASWMEIQYLKSGDEKFKPCPLLKKMVKKGYLGKKVGQGFFSYRE